MSLSEIRQAFYDVLKPAKSEWNVYALPAGTPTLPAILILPSDDTVWTRESMGSGCWYMDIHVLVPFHEMESAQRIIDNEISDKVEDSVFDILAKNSTLDGKVMDSTPMNIMFYGQSQVGEVSGVPIIGAQIRVEVREC